MLDKLFNRTVYVRVTRNQFRIRHIEGGRDLTLSGAEPFTTTRLLIGNFVVAQECLKQGLKKLHEGLWFAPSPRVVIHPLEMTEGGLSQVEERVLTELANGAGARKVIVWTGHELSDPEALQRAQGG